MAYQNWSVTNRKKDIFTPTAAMHSSVSPKLCMVIEDVVTIKNGAIIFQSNV